MRGLKPDNPMRMNRDEKIKTIEFILKKSKITPLQAYALGRHMDGLKQREIAEELGITQQMVAKHIKYAMAKIKKVVSKNGDLAYNHFEILNNSK